MRTSRQDGELGSGNTRGFRSAILATAPARSILEGLLVCLSLLLLAAPARAQEGGWQRGDVNGDGALDISDAVASRDYSFCGRFTPPCLEAWETAPFGFRELPLLTYLFLGGSLVPLEPGDCLGIPVTEPEKLAEFELGFEKDPEGGEGLVYATLTTTGNTLDRGADAWSLSIGAEGLKILSVDTTGTVFEELTEEFDLTWFQKHEVVDGGTGAISAIVPDALLSSCPQLLPPEGTVRIAALTVEPSAAASEEVPRLFYEDGRQGAGQPVKNIITLGDGGVSHFPTLGEYFPASEPTFLRGDCNDDGEVDISDAVCTLDWLFLGGETPGCVAVTNTNGDEKADVSDAVYLLSFLFLGGEVPAPPFPDCGPGLLATDEEMGCVTPSASCQ